jgi:2-oxoglutarate ferredoxin oxidoreductase subunit delta
VSRRDRAERRQRSSTQYIVLDKSRCEACWRCVEACPRSVLGRVDFLGHRHAKVRAADECQGCGRCVKACETGALSLRAVEGAVEGAFEGAFEDAASSVIDPR